MTKLTLKECQAAVQPTQRIIPENLKLWRRVKNTFTDKSNLGMMQMVYERMGGRFDIVDREQKTAFDALDDKINLGPLAHNATPETVEWVRDLKKSNPRAYDKLVNWE